ncbi:MAG: hypothetical protein ABSB26_09835 [Nitrososphaerales archaeon]
MLSCAAESGRRFYKRNRRSSYRDEYEKISKDLAVRTYLADLSKTGKPTSENSKRGTLLACRKFLEQTKRPITESTMQELVQFKRDNPKDTTVEQELKLWKAESNMAITQVYAARILGVFRRNYARLNLTIHVEGSGNKTIPIREPILRAIRQDEQLSDQHKDEIDLMAFSGERRQAINMTPVENVHLVDETESAIIDVPASVSKTATRHPCIIPKELAERLLERAQRLGYKVLNPNYNSLWHEITRLAKRKHNVLLTSHYMRKRFETLAERIPSTDMNPNHWVILMGSKPTLGHMPDIYSLLSNTELIQEYETYLMPRLALTGETIKPQANQLEQLRRENAELKEQLIRLTKLLTKQLEEQTT